MLSLFSVVFFVAVLTLIASIFICFSDAKLGLQVAWWSACVIVVDLFVLSLFWFEGGSFYFMQPLWFLVLKNNFTFVCGVTHSYRRVGKIWGIF